MADFCPLHGLPKYVQWHTKDGRRLFIAEMTDTHLLSTIRFLYRNEEVLRLRYFGKYFGGEGPSGDAAQYAYEQALEEFADRPLEDICQPLKNLLNEFDSRGLVVP